MINEIIEIVGKRKDVEIVAGHKLIEAQLEYVLEDDGVLYRTTIPLTQGGSVIIVVLPTKENIVGIAPGNVVTGNHPAWIKVEKAPAT